MGSDPDYPHRKTLQEYLVIDWEEFIIDKNHDWRLFVKDVCPPTEEKYDGFKFKCLYRAVTEIEGHVNNKITSLPDEYNLIFNGVAYFDGIRHLYFGNKENDGYLFRTDVFELSLALLKLREIELIKLQYVRNNS